MDDCTLKNNFFANVTYGGPFTNAPHTETSGIGVRCANWDATGYINVDTLIGSLSSGSATISDLNTMGLFSLR